MSYPSCYNFSKNETHSVNLRSGCGQPARVGAIAKGNANRISRYERVSKTLKPSLFTEGLLERRPRPAFPSSKPNISERKGWGGQNSALGYQALATVVSERSFGFPATPQQLRSGTPSTRPAIPSTVKYSQVRSSTDTLHIFGMPRTRLKPAMVINGHLWTPPYFFQGRVPPAATTE